MEQDEFNFDASTGAQLRDQGIELVRSHTPEQWKEAQAEAIMTLALAGNPFTAEDVRDICGDPPNSVNAMGAGINAAVKAGIMVQAGYILAQRPSAHRRLLRVYIGNGNHGRRSLFL
jgi:hypothetical protein